MARITKPIAGPTVSVPKGMDYSLTTTKVTTNQSSTPAARASVFRG